MLPNRYPVIDPAETGAKILSLRKARGLSVKDLQLWFGFKEPRAIYKWQQGETLPSVDHLLALSVLFSVPIESILAFRFIIKDSCQQNVQGS